MHSVFNVTSIAGDYSNKTITIQTNYIVDETTVNKQNVKLVDASSGTTVIYKLSTDKDKIIITLKEWPIPNNTYQVNVTFIKDKLGRDLVYPLTKDIEFKADTKLKAKIVYPQNNEAVKREHNLVYFSIHQINADETITAKPKPELQKIMNLPIHNEDVSDNSTIEAILGVESDIKYHIEFASDIAFSYIVKDYISEFTDGLIELDNGQYYARARIIEDEMHGDWSDTITFSVIPEIHDCLDDLLKESQKEYIEDVLAPIDFFLGEDEEIEIVSNSNNGFTYPEFYIEFNIDIDKDKLPSQLIAYRRDL